MIHELLHRWHINADTQQYKITLVVSVSLWLHCFEPKLKQIPIPHPFRPFQATQSPVPGAFSALKSSYGGGEIRNGWESFDFSWLNLGFGDVYHARMPVASESFYHPCPTEKRLPNGCRVFYEHPKLSNFGVLGRWSWLLLCCFTIKPHVLVAFLYYPYCYKKFQAGIMKSSTMGSPVHQPVSWITFTTSPRRCLFIGSRSEREMSRSEAVYLNELSAKDGRTQRLWDFFKDRSFL